MKCELFTITLEVLPGRVPGIARLRALLKLAIRSFSLKCIECRAVEPVSASTEDAQR